MKKVLYGTSALLVAGLFASAAEAAAPLKLNINGNLNAWMGYTDIDADGANGLYNKFDVATDGKIVFNANTKIDNGITLGAVAELEIGEIADWDDVYVYAESEYGKAILGATENAAVLLHHEVPNASPLSTNDIVEWTAAYSPVLLDSTAPNFDGNAQKISYITPKFAGFSLGVSYIPGAEVKAPFTSNEYGSYDKSVWNGNRDFYNAWTIAGAYDGKIGSVSLGADLGVASYNAVGGDAVVTYNGAISAEIQGFTAAISYIYSDLNAEDGEIKDASAWELGLGYKADKFSTSVSYFETKNGKTQGAGVAPFAKGKVGIVKLAGNYKLSAGVDAFAEFAYIDTDKFSNDDPSAWTIITGLGLTF